MCNKAIAECTLKRWGNMRLYFLFFNYYYSKSDFICIQQAATRPTWWMNKTTNIPVCFEEDYDLTCHSSGKKYDLCCKFWFNKFVFLEPERFHGNIIQCQCLALTVLHLLSCFTFFLVYRFLSRSVSTVHRWIVASATHKLFFLIVSFPQLTNHVTNYN